MKAGRRCDLALRYRFWPGTQSTSPGAAIVDVAAGDEQQVRQAVDVFQGRRADRLVRQRGQFDHQALGAPAHGARDVQRGGAGRSARQHEGAQRRQLGVQRIDLVLEALDLGIADAQALACRLPPRSGTVRSAPTSNRSFWMRTSMASTSA